VNLGTEKVTARRTLVRESLEYTICGRESDQAGVSDRPARRMSVRARTYEKSSCRWTRSGTGGRSVPTLSCPACDRNELTDHVKEEVGVVGKELVVSSDRRVERELTFGSPPFGVPDHHSTSTAAFRAL
jgi:hypothetical protein